tara:strand:+ start:227 stop:589 length:363 start_codon:yes stop_codon:yes gene_type:complete
MAIGVSLPITYDSSDGFALNYTIAKTIKQNFKMLLLTNPGERVMVPEFGVGLKRYLFSNFSESPEDFIRTRIMEQAERYMPSITIQRINFRADPDTNYMSISIKYAMPNLGLMDLLELTI